jgi:hypothetical protein
VKNAHRTPSDTDGGTSHAAFDGPTLTTSPVDLEPGGERPFVCQSFLLGNEHPLFVNGVVFQGNGVHHSTWSVIAEDEYDGPAGSANCEAFGFDIFAPKGPNTDEVLFGESPEASKESEIFPDGAAFVLPPRSKLFVSYHVLNTGSIPLQAGMSATLRLLYEQDVKTRLTSGGGMTEMLALPPNSRSRFTTECTFATPPTFKAYYVVPHYHRYGTGMRLELAGGMQDGKVVWQNEGAIGEPLGAQVEPPVDFTGATGFRFTCTYENTTSATITGGASAEQEMCGFGVSMDGTSQFDGIATPGFASPTLLDDGIDGDGVHAFTVGGCTVLSP